MMKIDVTKPIRTTCGKPVRYIGSLNKDTENWREQHLFAVQYEDQYEEAYIKSNEENIIGSVFGVDQYRIENVPETFEQWCVLFKVNNRILAELFNSEEVARAWANAKINLAIFAIKKIEVEKGEGL